MTPEERMSELKVVVRLKVHDGKLDEFKAAAADCMKRVREKDSGTLQYEWHFAPDMTQCVVLERYRDSEAVLEHMSNIGDAVGALLQVSDLSLDVFGQPSPALMAASEGMDITVHDHFQSI
jgi:quinol monooxygenase YgiN